MYVGIVCLGQTSRRLPCLSMIISSLLESCDTLCIAHVLHGSGAWLQHPGCLGSHRRLAAGRRWARLGRLGIESGRYRGVHRDRSGVLPGSTASRWSIRDRQGIDVLRHGIDTGSIGIDPVLSRDRPRIDPGSTPSRQSTWDRQGIDPIRYGIEQGLARGRSGRIDTGSIVDRPVVERRSAADPRSTEDRSGSISVRSGLIHSRARIASIMRRPPTADRPRTGPGSTPFRIGGRTPVHSGSTADSGPRGDRGSTTGRAWISHPSRSREDGDRYRIQSRMRNDIGRSRG